MASSGGGSSSTTTTINVAVVGAGPCGFVAARELRREGHQVVVFEKGDRLGGTWVYDPRVEEEEETHHPLRFQGEKSVGVQGVHSSVYRSLRTNVPRQIMGFLDYPFLKEGHGGDSRTFPRQQEVLSYLDDFSRDFRLAELIRFRSEVVRVEPSMHHGNSSRNQWIVHSRSSSVSEEELYAEVFDAVVVCNGHDTEPRFAQIPGIDKWPGKQIHSHNYRIPEPFRDQIVVLIGNGSSAHDISREISEVSKEVHLASRSPNVIIGKLDNYCNLWQHSMIECVYEDGKVDFQDGSSVYADIVFHCTGYKYYFPFLETNGIVSVEDNRVGPLYKHVFPPRWAPSLSFVGIPTRVIPFMTSELQSKWVAQVLSGKVILPSEKEMMNSVEDHYRCMEETGKPKHYTHKFDQDQFEYKNWLAAQVGLPPMEEWVEQMASILLKLIVLNLDGYRDHFDGEATGFNNCNPPLKRVD